MLPERVHVGLVDVVHQDRGDSHNFPTSGRHERHHEHRQEKITTRLAEKEVHYERCYVA